MTVPTMQELFYGRNEPTWIVNDAPLPPPMISPMIPPAAKVPFTVISPPRPVVLPPPVLKKPPIAVLPPTIELRVPMCCEKCVEKVRLALLELPGVQQVECDQYNQRVVVRGHMDPELMLRRVRRVKKKSVFWNTAITPVTYAVASKVPAVKVAPSVVAPSVAPVVSSHTGYSEYSPAYSSAYSRYVSPPRTYGGSYSRPYTPHNSYSRPYSPPYSYY